MKNKKISFTDYAPMMFKLYLRVAIMIFAAAVLVVLIYGLLVGHIGEWVVGLFTQVLGMNYNSATYLYSRIFRDYRAVFIFVTIIIFSFIMLFFLMTWYGKYFGTINDGIDALMDEKSGDIKMPADLRFIETKLNTVRKNLENRSLEAREAEQRKNDLVMYLAHDIKTPLTSVIGYLSLMDEAPDMPFEQRAKYLHITLEKAHRLEQLINEFFEITRYKLQDITLQKEDIDLYYMLVQMADEIYPQLFARGQSVIINSAEDVVAYGDANKLARVFNNILRNANAYSDENSPIEITVHEPNGKVIVTFKNKGTIPKETLAFIFEKFYRGANDRSSSTGGSGLGLAIAKEIVTLHGGAISAVSENNITIFTVELPINFNRTIFR